MAEKIRTLRVEIAKLVLSPGDILVVKVDEHITREQAAVLRENINPHLPADVKAMVLTKGISLAVLMRDKIAQRSAA